LRNPPEPLHHLDRDVLDVGGDLLYEAGPLDRREPRCLAQVTSDGDDDVIEDLGGTLMISRCPMVTGSKLPGQTATIIVSSDRSNTVTNVPP
jgi:hypothetical protein